MNEFFTSFVYQPVYNLIVFFANIFPVANFGLAIVAATVVIKFLFLSLSRQQIESQKKLQELQPKIKAIQERYKDDKERQSREMMELYKTNKVNPFMGCLPLVVQIVFLITIYRVIMHISDSGFGIDAGMLYSFASDPGTLSSEFFGIADLQGPSPIFAVLAALGQFYQMKMLSQGKSEEKKPEEGREPDFASIMNKQMLYMGPLLTLWIGFRYSSALSLYWLVSTVFSIAQQWFILKGNVKKEGVESNT